MAVSDLAFNGIARLLGKVGGQETSGARTTARRGPGLVTESLLVDRPVGELYQYWRDVENVPRVLAFVERVQPLDARRARWTVPGQGRGSPPAEWEAHITDDVPDERIAWRLRTPTGAEYQAFVRFAPGPRGTGIRVELLRDGKGTGEVLGAPALARVRKGLRDFKRVMEAGEALTTVGQSRGTCGAQGGKRPG